MKFCGPDFGEREGVVFGFMGRVLWGMPVDLKSECAEAEARLRGNRASGEGEFMIEVFDGLKQYQPPATW